MIPESFHQLWQKGIETNDYYLKLCGSGGGGFILGFTQDFEKALHWFTKAAQQGDSEIQELLVKLYKGQMQISPNYVKAYAWANVLAENHDGHQQNLDGLRSYLSGDELKNAQELSLDHYAKIQKNRLIIN